MKMLMAGFAGLTMILVTSAGVANEIAPRDVEINDDIEATQSLTGAPGDPDAGREWFADRKLGNCLACHVNADLAEQPFHGNVGPEMSGVADRYSEPQLRAIVVNSKAVFGEQTIMPGFYSLDHGDRTLEKFAESTIMSAQQVEDVVAYLMTLTE